jgi:transposase
VRNAIHDFEERGLDSLARKPKGPPDRVFDEKKREALQELAHQSPRSFGKPRSTWTLSVLAEVAFEEGLTEREVSKETVRQAVLALRSSWQRAKTWITSPDPQYELKKSRETV